MARILIIEDYPGMRDVLESALRSAGHEVLLASNGSEGVALFQAYPASLVITDILMPEQNGLETIRQLCSKNPGLKIVAISGASEATEVLGIAQTFGAQRTFVKPFSEEDILRAVEELLQEPPTFPGAPPREGPHPNHPA